MVIAMHELNGSEGVATLDLPEWPRLLQLARQAERTSSILGLTSFLMAKAKQVSDGVASAMHGGKVGAALFEAHRSDRAIAQFFVANPWWPVPDTLESLEERWTFLGGWFGLPPTTALATTDGAARRHDPVNVFVPPFAVAYAADLVVRLAGQTPVTTWSELWDRWGALLPAVGHPPSRRNDSLADSLARCVKRGADPEIAGQRVCVDGYPGFDALARQLKTSELRLV
jgi:hypothetical protein